MDNLRKQADMTNLRPIGRPTSDPAQRFDSHVNFSGPLCADLGSECWLWTGSPQGNGYAQFEWGGRAKRSRALVHRWNYERLVGPIPDGHEVDHLCKTPLCVNPQHLEAVPPRVNNARSDSPSGKNARMVMCKKGLHELSGDNLSPCYLARGQRRCRHCLAEWHRERRRKAASVSTTRS